MFAYYFALFGLICLTVMPFWLTHGLEVATTDAIADTATTCSGFFTVLAELEPWKSQGTEHCESTFYKMDYAFRSLSHQMEQMNTVLKVYSSYRPRPTCTIPYANIELIHFNATELMIEYDMQAVINKFAPYTLGEHNYARVSDMLRILLAHKYGAAYMDLDVHYLNYDKRHFAKPFVATHIWAPVRCSVEITNAAFCLPPSALLDLRDHMVDRILKGSDLYLYTELGPLMFTKVLMNRHAVTYYSVNHPEEYHLAEMAEGVRAYNHSLLHLTSSLRLLLHRDTEITTSFEDLVDQLRAELRLSPLMLPPSTLTLKHYRLALRAMYYNHPSIEYAEQLYPELLNQWREEVKQEKEEGQGEKRKKGESMEVISSSSSSMSQHQHQSQQTFQELLGVLQVVMANTSPDSSSHRHARTLWSEINPDTLPVNAAVQGRSQGQGQGRVRSDRSSGKAGNADAVNNKIGTKSARGPTSTTKTNKVSKSTSKSKVELRIDGDGAVAVNEGKRSSNVDSMKQSKKKKNKKSNSNNNNKKKNKKKIKNR